ncbi:hypothetical protein [Novosphingobium sp. Fuku2-ISO-50]|uniref:hypothetical protein n=1 Tax=Novosphingobium sp. Fuku2-ISO-50 TaxID=1739114 RepID=UPI000ADBF7B5|nr:hypothetical protein [Novosphingobium sp. Fuku2-ISO-50]
MTETTTPRFPEHLRDLDDKAIVRSLGLVLPAACVPGVAMNVRLLADHIAILRGERR